MLRVHEGYSGFGQDAPATPPVPVKPQAPAYVSAIVKNGQGVAAPNIKVDAYERWGGGSFPSRVTGDDGGVSFPMAGEKIDVILKPDPGFGFKTSPELAMVRSVLNGTDMATGIPEFVIVKKTFLETYYPFLIGGVVLMGISWYFGDHTGE